MVRAFSHVWGRPPSLLAHWSETNQQRVDHVGIGLSRVLGEADANELEADGAVDGAPDLLGNGDLVGAGKLVCVLARLYERDKRAE